MVVLLKMVPVVWWYMGFGGTCGVVVLLWCGGAVVVWWFLWCGGACGVVVWWCCGVVDGGEDVEEEWNLAYQTNFLQLHSFHSR